jgi:CRISPR-associated endonuclease/helicase Cas3
MDETWGQVRECLLDGGKVLWVHNTVDRAMRTCAEALRLDLPVEPYHSRFRYKDRLVRQRTVIDGFARNMPPMLAVTTQVAEMSLDLSADLLVSEWAPVAAMIQRLGRLNRFDDEPLSCGAGLFVDPENLLPYDEEEMFGAREWLDHLADGEPKSQVDLAETFVRVLSKLENRVFPAPRCEWLDGLWSSLKDVRTVEEAGHTVDVVREEDLLTGEPNDELAIPMPFPKEWDLRTWSRAGRYVVAPRGTIAYDTVRGAQWNTKTQ